MEWLVNRKGSATDRLESLVPLEYRLSKYEYNPNIKHTSIPLIEKFKISNGKVVSDNSKTITVMDFFVAYKDKTNVFAYQINDYSLIKAGILKVIFCYWNTLI